VLVALAWPVPIAAQSAADHFAAGVHAYDELQFADAVDHLRRSVASSDSGLVGVVRSQALAYLGAAEWFRDGPIPPRQHSGSWCCRIPRSTSTPCGSRRR